MRMFFILTLPKFYDKSELKQHETQNFIFTDRVALQCNNCIRANHHFAGECQSLQVLYNSFTTWCDVNQWSDFLQSDTECR